MKKYILALLTLALIIPFFAKKVLAMEGASQESAQTSLLYVTFSSPGVGVIAENQEIVLTKGAGPYTINPPVIQGYTYNNATFYKDQFVIGGENVNLPLQVRYQDPPAGYYTHMQWVDISYVPTGRLFVYRLYYPDLQVHLYTTDTNEYNVLQGRGWNGEGVAWSTETDKGEPVYRMYNPGLKVHLYTRDANEYNILGTRGWNQEGVAYRSYGEVAIYRLYNPDIKKHLYTRDENEKNILQTRGWQYEGIAWYSQP